MKGSLPVFGFVGVVVSLMGANIFSASGTLFPEAGGPYVYLM
jgi:amino acid transporter